MRIYSTTKGVAREDKAGELSLLDLPYTDLGQLLRHTDLEVVATAAVREKVLLSGAGLLAPIPRPGKVPIIGLNYHSHTEEVLEWLAKIGREMTPPTEPNFHLTPGSAVIGPNAEIVLPQVAPNQVDYEGEIAVIIGKRAHLVAESDAWECVAGLSILNDVSARDIQLRAMTGDVTVSVGHAKSLDTFKPLGPCLVTADQFSEPLDLGLQTRVNGELRQDARTSDFVYQIFELIAYVSRFMTLEPGDVLSTGSPRGVGFYLGSFLAPGDQIEITVEGIGTLTNTVRSS